MLSALGKDNANMEMQVQPNEFMDSFLEFERQFEMFKVRINNIRVWHYLRFSVYDSLIEKKGNIAWGKRLNQKNVSSKKFEELVHYMFKRYISCNQFFAHKRDILIISHGRKYKEDNKYYKCPYTYLLDEYLSDSHYILDGRTPDGNYELQRSHNILYSDINAFNKIKQVKFSI